MCVCVGGGEIALVKFRRLFRFPFHFSPVDVKLALHYVHLCPALHVFIWLRSPCNIYIPGVGWSSHNASLIPNDAYQQPYVRIGVATLCCHVGVTCHSVPHNHSSALNPVPLRRICCCYCFPASYCLRLYSKHRLLNYSIWKVCEV